MTPSEKELLTERYYQLLAKESEDFVFFEQKRIKDIACLTPNDATTAAIELLEEERERAHIGFAEWIGKGCRVYSSGKWVVVGTLKEPLTTAELFILYKASL